MNSKELFMSQYKSRQYSELSPQIEGCCTCHGSPKDAHQAFARWRCLLEGLRSHQTLLQLLGPARQRALVFPAC